MRNILRRKLRIRFVLFSMLALLLLQSTIIVVCVYNNYHDMVKRSDAILSQLHKNPSTNMRYFSVKLHPGKSAIRLDTVQHVTVSPEQAGSYAKMALQSGKDKGFVDEYRYHIIRSNKGSQILFLSRAASIEMHRTATGNIIAVSACGLLTVLIILIPVSGWAVQPIVENHIRQKRFITVASHELKTPLTVISTDAQLLQDEFGQSQWIDGILQQVTQLTKLTQDLVTLSKAEEFDGSIQKTDFSVSKSVAEVLDSYRGLVQQNAICLQLSVPNDISYRGSETEIRHLIQLLLDNTFKYCPKAGTISVTLKQELRGVRLRIENTTAPITNEDAHFATERFFRGQNAAGKEGFGLGLSIAQAIAGRHNGNLSVSLQTETFRVEVILR